MSHPPSHAAPLWRRTATLLVALALVHVVLVLPVHQDRILPAAFLRLSGELIALVALLAVLPERVRRAALWPIAVLLLLVLAAKAADIGTYAALARPFNPVLDAPRLNDVVNLLYGTFGPTGAKSVVGGVTIAVVILLLLLKGAVSRIARATAARGPTLAAAGLAAAVFAGLWSTGASLDARQPVATVDTARQIARHVTDAIAALGDRAAFARIAADDVWRDRPGGDLLTALRGKDVVVVFIESYGRTALEDPRYAATVRPLLEEGTRRLAAAGIHARSGLVTSPTVGGMSWLAHGTLLSGLWVDNQLRYDSLVTSDRMTLNAAFRRAGWRTVAVMPAITMAWPEGDFFGYDQVYAAAGLGYRGKPFNWVTMPDQFTLAAFQRLERAPGPRRPVMAEIALISSHAPWTPIPDRIDWSAVGDGRAFDAMATAGDPPDVVWRDPDRVREQYRRSILYTLDVLVSYLETFGDENLVVLALGDHQPAPIITGDDAGREVPVHLFARDRALLDRIADWGWTEGLIPDADGPVWPMSDLRDRWLAAFTDAEAAPPSAPSLTN